MEADKQPQEITLNTSDLKAFLQQMVQEQVGEAIKQAMANLPQPQIEQTSTPTPVSQPKPTPIKEKEVINWELKSNAELWGTKASGAATEKIRRSFEAICLYNDTVATGDDDRLAITNLALRELSGVNGVTVGEWIKSHADEIITHHFKYNMQNSKDHSKVETYYNLRHGQLKIDKILHEINYIFLDGVALKPYSSFQLSRLQI